MSLLYVDERVRHEGYDIELMAARQLPPMPELPGYVAVRARAGHASHRAICTAACADAAAKCSGLTLIVCRRCIRNSIH